MSKMVQSPKANYNIEHFCLKENHTEWNYTVDGFEQQSVKRWKKIFLCETNLN